MHVDKGPLQDQVIRSRQLPLPPSAGAARALARRFGELLRLIGRTGVAGGGERRRRTSVIQDSTSSVTLPQGIESGAVGGRLADVLELVHHVVGRMVGIQ